MPTDPDPEPSPPKPPTPPVPPAQGPTETEVKGWVTEALSELLGKGGKPEGDPDLSTDKKLEAYVEKLTRDALDVIRKEEAEAGKPPPDPAPDPDPDPEKQPERKTSWQQKLQGWVWGGAGNG